MRASASTAVSSTQSTCRSGESLAITHCRSPRGRTGDPPNRMPELPPAGGRTGASRP